MNKLTRLCSRFNRLGASKVCVFKVCKVQYGYRYLVRFSPSGDWSLPDHQARFDTLPDVFDFVNGLFR